MTTVDIRPAHRFEPGETLANRDFPLEVFAEGDALFDAMLRDINLAQHSVRLESYILTSDVVGRAFVEALCRCSTRGVKVWVRADHVMAFP